MELLIMIQTLRLDSAARITAVVPYLCYGRSDKKDQPRVPITARLVADMIEVAGADRYMTLDPHAGQVQGFFSIPGDVLTASHLLVEHINDKPPQGYAGPGGRFGRPRLCQEGTQLRRRHGHAHRVHRKAQAGQRCQSRSIDLDRRCKDRDVIIVDDEVDTGGSIAQAVDVVKQNGARDVYLAFVHPILSRDGAERLASLPIKQIITTDSAPISPEKMKHLEGKITVLSVASLLGEVIRRAHEGRSVGEMFNE
jgi:ribose-phosphate pyrophosphokinase